MRRSRKLIIGAATLVALLVATPIAYRARYSMLPVQGLEVAAAPDSPRVLIATQGSEFKDAVVAGVLAHLKAAGAAVKVVDVATLEDVVPAEWAAIVVLHTWEMGKPPAAVQAFLQRAGQRPAVIVVSTSGGGDARIEGVDVISAASRMEDAGTRVAQVAARLDAVIAAAEPAAPVASH